MRLIYELLFYTIFCLFVYVYFNLFFFVVVHAVRVIILCALRDCYANYLVNIDILYVERLINACTDARKLQPQDSRRFFFPFVQLNN